eukprot:scaffold12174_cov88-Skeletonema_marinoi.AAC.1
MGTCSGGSDCVLVQPSFMRSVYDVTSLKELLKCLQSPVEIYSARRRRSAWWKTEPPIDFDSVCHIPKSFEN